MAEETCQSGDDLPVDVLRLIGSSLLAKDRIYFRSVCRTWRSAVPRFPSPPLSLTKSLTSFASITPFPLLMYYGGDDSFCNFYHPIYNNTPITMTSPNIANAIIHFSKDGWLIMSRGEVEMFFYNPLIDDRIDLPYLDEYGYKFITISFSSVPTSPDCTVFGVRYNSSHHIWFSFIRIGEGEDVWTSCCVKKKGIEFIGSLSNPVFYNGLFYYLDKKGLLGTFDPTQSGDNGWTVLAKPYEYCNSIFSNYLIECDGELVSVFMCRKSVKILKLDFATMTWKDVKNLGDRALFVSRTASLSANLKQEIKGMANKVFFPRFHGKNGDGGGGGIFYSLNSRKFHTLGSSYNSNDLCGTTLKLFCTWILPSQDLL